MNNFTRSFFVFFLLLAGFIPVGVFGQSEFHIARNGGDFTGIHDAVSSPLVTDGDILIVAADTFIEGSTYIMDKALTIRGQGAGQTVIMAADSAGKATSRKFTVLFDSLSTKEMVFENLTIQNGYHPDETGGAIYQYFGTLTIRNCEFIDNYASVKGGAIFVEYGNIQCFNTTFAGNKTINPFVYYMYGGGAVAYQEYDGTQLAYFENCTFVNNSTSSYGGALNGYMPTEIVNSTFTGNSAKVAGGFFSSGYDLYLTNSIVAGNHADSLGSNDIHQDFFSYYSLIQDTSTGIIYGTDNILGVNPGLLPLAQNGGLTRTCAIPYSSIAKDHGKDTNVPALDQRGVAIFNDIKDIGSFEFNEMPVLNIAISMFDTTALIHDTLELSYDLSGRNILDTLYVQADHNLGLALTSEGSVNQNVIIIPDANGQINQSVFVKYATENVGKDTVFIKHWANLLDTAFVKLSFNVVARPVSDNDTVLMTENETFTFGTGNFTYSDADGDPFDGIIIETVETDGDLEYNGSDVVQGTVCMDVSLLTFSPVADESGFPYASFSFRVVDTAGYASDPYTMTIDVNGFPVVQNAIPDGNATTETEYNYVIPVNTFADPQVNQTLSYSASLSDDGALPAWLSFDALTRTFSGTPADADTLTLKVTASDNLGASVSDEFVLTIALINHAPVVANPIPDGLAFEDLEYTYIIPENTFTDADGNTLVYSATLSDGNALPAWLGFEAETRTLSGTPDEIGTITIRVTADDGIADPVYDDFTITVAIPDALPGNLSSQIRFYPNPTTGKITVEPNGSGLLEISVLNLSGNLLIKQTIREAKSDIDLTTYPKGVYLLKVSDGKQDFVKQIVLQ